MTTTLRLTLLADGRSDACLLVLLRWLVGDLRQWLTEQGFLSAGAVKPARPKEAMLAVLRETRVKPSAAIFAEAARKVGLDRCQDRSFLRFRQILRDWFPQKK